ncbi:non-ribosomal peptide synthetase [Streptomyces sp. ME19-01-6]|uniref:non-ribosomal peptide synthetase n=1 Tax=Streptomyces sp. ME19-01-6 TaxID=3028686 RepID=UPI0029BA1602|nr:non-ribosomal peptide synthetase [Streptomyces sp. ME19-01-6]MDX3225298.1 non-ribosomal peptide synthetase [Streptomyces sp. ME19-01-6]
MSPQGTQTGDGFAADGAAGTIHGRFTAQAALTPTRIAVSAEDGELTYGELERRSDRLATRLRAMGVRRQGRVGLSVRRSTDLAVSLLAVLKAGAAYVALDPRQPPGRRELTLRNAGVQVLLADSRSPDAEAPGVTTLRVDTGSDTDRDQLDAGPVSGAEADDLAYIVYTSGSTGAPKGVAVTHRGVLRLVADPVCASALPDDRFLQFAPVAFDASTLEIWAPLLNGARLVFFPGTDPSLAQLADFVRDEGITCLWLTAGLFHQIADTQLEKLKGVRRLVVGGDVVLPKYVNRVLAELPQVRVVNGYGPTENTTFTCCHQVTAPIGEGAVPIGRPVTGTRIRVLDAGLRPVGVGEPGELYAVGAGLARGYADRPGVTAAHFVADPWSEEPGGRMYRTGDLVRVGADGVLEFLGRTDHEVKVSGFRVDLAQVEAAVLEQDGVKDAAVVAPRGSDGTRRVVCYVVPEQGRPPSTLGLRRRLEEILPAYAAPSGYRMVNELPLTVNGKVDRGDLESRDVRRRPDVFADYAAPETWLERAIAAMWADLLGLSDVGVDDDFIQLGGYSLLSMKISADLESEYGVTVTPRDFYTYPTVRGVARLIEERRGTPGEPVATRSVGLNDGKG